MPPGDAARVLRTLRRTAQRVDAAGVTNAHDLTGRIFQRLIADRKYLATFYTLPASAALLARIAVAKMNVDWSDARAIANLRIADFACGTGALLSAVYEQVAARHERAGGDSANLHTAMMEEVLYGYDVMPSAIHITGSTLSGAHPNVGFGQSRLYTMPYGRQEDGSVKIGSLELLQSSAAMTLFNTSDPALRTGSAGEETAAQVLVEAPDEGFDLVIMNPPFTRATNHEGAHADVTNPAFAAFNATRADQTRMGRRINQLGKDTCYHGNAGIASAFAALGHKKLKPGGVLAMVLPLSAAAGLSWQKFRRTLAGDYTDLTVFSIAANGRDMSFSSDTGMAECLVIARKTDSSERRARFISLSERPQGFVQASAVARSVLASGQARRLEDGPYGGEELMLGDSPSGEILDAPLSRGRFGLGKRPPLRLLPRADRLRPLRLPPMASGKPPCGQTEGSAPRRSRQTRPRPPRHHRPRSARPIRQDNAQSNRDISRPLEPQRQKRNTHDLRPRLSVASSPGNGRKGRRGLGYRKPLPP